MVFFRRLSVLLTGGLSLLTSLRLLASGEDGETAALCSRLLAALGRGVSLSRAMALEAGYFDFTALTLVEAGERSGQLATVLEQLAAYYREQAALKASLGQALLYPLFLLAASCLLSFFFLLYVLPALAKTYAAMGAQPTPELAAALALAAWLADYGYLVLGGLLLALPLLGAGKARFSRLLERLPYLRGLRRQLLEERFCRLLALLLKSGISLGEAIGLAAEALGRSRYRQGLAAFSWGLGRGMSIEQGAELAKPLLSPLTRELVRAGAASGSLTEMLEEAAALAGQELAARLRRCQELLAPCLLLATALIIALVLCFMLRPLFSLFTVLPT